MNKIFNLGIKERQHFPDFKYMWFLFIKKVVIKKNVSCNLLGRNFKQDFSCTVHETQVLRRLSVNTTQSVKRTIEAFAKNLTVFSMVTDLNIQN